MDERESTDEEIARLLEHCKVHYAPSNWNIFSINRQAKRGYSICAFHIPQPSSSRFILKPPKSRTTIRIHWNAITRNNRFSSSLAFEFSLNVRRGPICLLNRNEQTNRENTSLIVPLARRFSDFHWGDFHLIRKTFCGKFMSVFLPLT